MYEGDCLFPPVYEENCGKKHARRPTRRGRRGPVSNLFATLQGLLYSHLGANLTERKKQIATVMLSMH